MSGIVIGVDFDNTIVCYSELFYREALLRELVPPDQSLTKAGVRDHLKQKGCEVAWLELQGHVYGSAIRNAPPFPGVVDFFVKCRELGVPHFVVSHRTARPIAGSHSDLHEVARQWLQEKLGVGSTEGCVFFEQTRQMKLERIGALGCTHFIDDLAEVFAERGFPADVMKILFDPLNEFPSQGPYLHAGSWSEISNLLFDA